MEILDFSEEEKLSFIFNCIEKKLQEKQYFFSFNDSNKRKFSEAEFLVLDNQAGIEFQEFSELIHQIPTSKSINTASSSSMWREYEKIFFCGVISQLEKPKLSMIKNQKGMTLDESLISKENTYNMFQEKDEILNFEIIDLYNSSDENSVLKIDKLKSQLKENFVNWKKKGFKDEIEYFFDEQFTESNFSLVHLWSKWKQKMLLAENAGFKGVHSKFGSFYANFKGLTNNLNWNTIELKLDKLIFNSKREKNLSKNISSIKLEVQQLKIDREWFNEEVFEADFWKWHPQYNSDLLSYGLNDIQCKGELPSFIENVIFVKNIKYRPKAHFILDLLEWVGRCFKEIPYKPLFNESEDIVYLLAFKAKKTPLSPKNSSEL